MKKKNLFLFLMDLITYITVAGVGFVIGQHYPLKSAEISFFKEKADCEAQGGLFQYTDITTGLRRNGDFRLHGGSEPTMSCIILREPKTLWFK